MTAITRSHSVAMTEATHDKLVSHLIREDGQEDVCLAIWQPSSGRTRHTSILTAVELPRPGERAVHGNASFTGGYVQRVAEAAAAASGGVVIIHSHPNGSGWQTTSPEDADAEQAYCRFVPTLTGLPLVGMTLAGVTTTWSARIWTADGDPDDSRSIRIVGDTLTVSRPPGTVAQPGASQVATVNAWGSDTHRNIAGLHVVVVGVGSTGLDIVTRLAATGVATITSIDPDLVELRNLDRLIGATADDIGRPKVDVADRIATRAATATGFTHTPIRGSITDAAGVAVALDADLIFCAVDHRPWARAILNMLAHTDLISVIDGGVSVDTFADGRLRNATWRSHVIRPGRPCMACNGQLELSDVPLDQQGLLDDADYIRAAGTSQPGTQNVTILAMAAAAGMLTQFVSYLAQPSGRTDPGPLQTSLASHTTEHVDVHTRTHCPVERLGPTGDSRPDLL